MILIANDEKNPELLGDFARKLKDPKFREIHIYYSPIDYYIIRPENVLNVEVREYAQGSQQVLHIENKNWDLDLPTQLIGTVVWHKKSESPEQHPLTKALNNINYQRITVTLTNQKDLVIPADQITSVEETGRSVNVYFRNDNMIDIDLRYVVSISCERRLGHVSKVFDIALDEIENKNWKEGINYLTEVVKIDPEDHDAFHRLGYAYLRNDQPDEAIKYLDKAIQINPFRSLTFLFRVKALQDKDEMEEAESSLLEAITKFPEDIHLKMELSSVYTRRKKYDEAIANQNSILEMDSDNYEEWEYLGYIADQKGDLELAIQAFQKVLDLSPEGSPAYLRSMERLGCRYCHKGNLDFAITTFKTLIEKYPKHTYGYDLLSCVYRRTNDYDLAEQAVLKAIEINPNESSNWASLAYSIWRKDLKQAEEASRKAVQMDDKSDYNWTALAKVLFVKKEIKEAVEACHKAEELGPDSGTNMYNLADGYATIKDTKKVLHYLRKALELDRTQVGLLKDDKEFDFIRDNENFIKLQKEFSS